ncbi:unnamed protein product [Sphenostylis stenocarpa]|uniref:CCAAT-binding factor domain-containing protein n=1 Tax=Sphenostylis stenocarpa TaxID=92480 RepID=A0AA86STX7_9FABA|nr:unnamed protein product [Sphenostylis stenocarpa]
MKSPPASPSPSHSDVPVQSVIFVRTDCKQGRPQWATPLEVVVALVSSCLVAFVAIVYVMLRLCARNPPPASAAAATAALQLAEELVEEEAPSPSTLFMHPPSLTNLIVLMLNTMEIKKDKLDILSNLGDLVAGVPANSGNTKPVRAAAVPPLCQAMASVDPPRKKKKGRYGVAELKTLGSQLLSSASHINNLPLLLTFLSPSSPPHHVLESLLSLHSFFLPLLPKLPSSSSSSSSSAAADQSEFIYLTWLRSKFDEFIKSLLDILASPQSDETLKELVLDTLMEFVKVANGGIFHSALYHKLLLSIVHSTSSATFLVDLLGSKYFKYIDVRYFTFISLKKLATTLEGKDASDDKFTSADGSDESQLNSNMECFIHNMYYTISHVPPLQGSDNTSDLEMWSGSSESDHKQLSGDLCANDKLLKSKKPNKNVLSAAKIAKKMKLKFTKAWIAYLRLPLPLDVYKEVVMRFNVGAEGRKSTNDGIVTWIVLVNLHQAVIPHLSNPIMLCDFLTRSYDVGGVVSVMALSSLFVLMTQYGLEYPNFYEKLYALLVPSTFMAKHRARFFQLLDSCLKSPLLPAYLAASFAKKLSRLLLSVPPSGALVITALIHNILRRHPSVNCLVHREDGVDEGKSDHRTDEGAAANSDNVKTGAVPSKKSGIDHFNSIETDPKKSAAMNLLEQGVLFGKLTLFFTTTVLLSQGKFALSLGNDLTVRAKTSEVNVGDFSAGSYATILGAEMTRRVKQVPLAFYKATPSSLFSETDFAGWTFKCEETPEMINDNNESSTKDLS